IVATGTIEIGLRLRRTRSIGSRQDSRYHQTRPEEAASPHTRLLSINWTFALFGRRFDRHEPVRLMNGVRARRSTARQHADLESVFLVDRFHRTLPRAVKFLQHLLGRCPYTVDRPLQWFEMTGLVAA